jgi:hypothetical protein
MEKQLEYFKAKDMMTNTRQTNMVNLIVSLTQVLSLTFARDILSVPINKPQVPTKNHINKLLMLVEDHINNIQMSTATLAKKTDDD